MKYILDFLGTIMVNRHFNPNIFHNIDLKKIKSFLSVQFLDINHNVTLNQNFYIKF